jgi:hypothetical protein
MSHGRDGLLQESSFGPKCHAASDGSAALLLTELLAERNHTREREHKLAPTAVYFGASGQHSIAVAHSAGVESR